MTAKFHLLLNSFQITSKKLVDGSIQHVFRILLNIALVSLNARRVVFVLYNAIESCRVLHFEARVVVNSCTIKATVLASEHKFLRRVVFL